jgi:hypothetical protein
VTLPKYPHLGEVRICSTSFARLFCTDEFLKHPHVFYKKFDRLMKVVDEAVSFYEENGYQFEGGGVFFGMKGEEGQIVVYKVVASFFKVLHEGYVPFQDKVHIHD